MNPFRVTLMAIPLVTLLVVWFLFGLLDTMFYWIHQGIYRTHDGIGQLISRTCDWMQEA